jgi:hypothetical protein
MNDEDRPSPAQYSAVHCAAEESTVERSSQLHVNEHKIRDSYTLQSLLLLL